METSKPLGLYIHLPFCTGKCNYCDFYSLPNQDEDTIRTYLRKLREELRGFSAFSKKIDTVYLGGGTPGILSHHSLDFLLNSVFSLFSVAENTEISIEVNPNVHLPFADYARMGINRVSIGVQSLKEETLGISGRRHTAREGLEALEQARAQIANVSADFILGLPGEGIGECVEGILKALPFLTHLSAYLLKVEEGTPFWALRQEGKLGAWSDDEQADGYELMRAALAERGIRRYEISNFARPERESAHNLKYWRGEAYFGAGAAAHSFYGGVRAENPRDLNLYLTQRSVGEGGGERKQIPSEERLFERIMLGLRLEEGIDVRALEKEFGVSFDKRFATALREGMPLLCSEGRRLKMKEDAFLLESYVARLFLD